MNDNLQPAVNKHLTNLQSNSTVANLAADVDAESGASDFQLSDSHVIAEDIKPTDNELDFILVRGTHDVSEDLRAIKSELLNQSSHHKAHAGVKPATTPYTSVLESPDPVAEQESFPVDTNSSNIDMLADAKQPSSHSSQQQIEAILSSKELSVCLKDCLGNKDVNHTDTGVADKLSTKDIAGIAMAALKSSNMVTARNSVLKRNAMGLCKPPSKGTGSPESVQLLSQNASANSALKQKTSYTGTVHSAVANILLSGSDSAEQPTPKKFPKSPTSSPQKISLPEEGTKSLQPREPGKSHDLVTVKTN